MSFNLTKFLNYLKEDNVETAQQYLIQENVTSLNLYFAIANVLLVANMLKF
jgi:hypothetical protein